jgi:hypothetical protein
VAAATAAFPNTSLPYDADVMSQSGESVPSVARRRSNRSLVSSTHAESFFADLKRQIAVRSRLRVTV